MAKEEERETGVVEVPRHQALRSPRIGEARFARREIMTPVLSTDCCCLAVALRSRGGSSGACRWFTKSHACPCARQAHAARAWERQVPSSWPCRRQSPPSWRRAAPSSYRPSSGPWLNNCEVRKRRSPSRRASEAAAQDRAAAEAGRATKRGEGLLTAM
jgi:hypothetical protein